MGTWESTLLIGTGVGLACALAGFWLVRARGWGGRRTSVLVSLLSGLLGAGFFYAVFAFYGSSACLRDGPYPFFP